MSRPSLNNPPQREIAYVVSRHPTFSNTFMGRELLELERRGYHLHIYSLRQPPTEQRPSQYDEVRAATTQLPHWSNGRWGRMLLDHLWCLSRHPGRYLKTLRRAAGSVTRGRILAFTSAPSLVRALTDRPSVGHFHAYFAGVESSVSLFAHWLTGLPFSFTAHSTDLFSNLRSLPDKVREAEFVVAISEFNRQAIIERCGPEAADKVHVIHCALDLAPFDVIREARRNTVVERDRAPFSILTVARLVPQKGYQYLIEALALLKQRGCEFRWTVVGDGPLENDLKGMVRERGLDDGVEFLGVVSGTRVMELLARVDAFVLPCVWAPGARVDGIPVAAMEAMAAEVPVVSTAISGIPELIADGVSGLLVEPENPQALAEAIQTLMDDAGLRERLAAAGRERIAAEFEITENVQKLRALFEKVHLRSRY